MTIQPVRLEWTLGDRLRKIRRELKLTQEQMAKALDLPSAAAWGNWEADIARPRDLLDVAEKLERAFAVPRAWVLYGEMQDRVAEWQRPTVEAVREAQRALAKLEVELPHLDSNQEPAGYLPAALAFYRRNPKCGVNLPPLSSDLPASKAA